MSILSSCCDIVFSSTFHEDSFENCWVAKCSLTFALVFLKYTEKVFGHHACKMLYAIRLLFLPSTQKKSLVIDLISTTPE